MPEFSFPEARFIEAGASTEETTQLRDEFYNSDVGIQRSFSDFWASQSIAGLRDVLASQRSRGHFVSVQGSAPASSESVSDDATSALSDSDVLSTTKDETGESDASVASE